VMAEVSSGQSLRLELVDFDGNVLAIATTANLGQFMPFSDKDPSEPLETVFLDLSGIKGQRYFLRMSGHSPGDIIHLFLTQNLIKGDGPSVEDILSGNGASPMPTSMLIEPGDDPSDRLPGSLHIAPATRISFVALPEDIYQIELLDDDGVWQLYLAPFWNEHGMLVGENLPQGTPLSRSRVRKILGGSTFTPDEAEPVLELSYLSMWGFPFRLKQSDDLIDWRDIDSLDEFLMEGDGSIFRWTIHPQPDEPRLFFRVEPAIE